MELELKGTGRDRTRWGTAQRLSNATEVDDDCLDPVALSLYFRHESFHFVPIKGVGDILRNVNSGTNKDLERLTLRILRVAMVARMKSD